MKKTIGIILAILFTIVVLGSLVFAFMLYGVTLSKALLGVGISVCITIVVIVVIYGITSLIYD